MPRTEALDFEDAEGRRRGLVGGGGLPASAPVASHVVEKAGPVVLGPSVGEGFGTDRAGRAPDQVERAIILDSTDPGGLPGVAVLWIDPDQSFRRLDPATGQGPADSGGVFVDRRPSRRAPRGGRPGRPPRSGRSSGAGGRTWRGNAGRTRRWPGCRGSQSSSRRRSRRPTAAGRGRGSRSRPG